MMERSEVPASFSSVPRTDSTVGATLWLRFGLNSGWP
jgi:hypothetical protein